MSTCPQWCCTHSCVGLGLLTVYLIVLCDAPDCLSMNPFAMYCGRICLSFLGPYQKMVFAHQLNKVNLFQLACSRCLSTASIPTVMRNGSTIFSIYFYNKCLIIKMVETLLIKFQDSYTKFMTLNMRLK